MTPVEVAALRVLLAKATPGPWAKDGPFWWRGGDTDPDCTTIVTTVAGRLPVFVLPEDHERSDNAEDDAALIVALVNHAPALLDAAQAHETLLTDLRELAEQAELALSLGMPAQTVTDLRAVIAAHEAGGDGDE